MQISAGYAALHGFPAGTREIMRREWRAGVDHDDLARVEELRNQAFRSDQRTPCERFVKLSELTRRLRIEDQQVGSLHAKFVADWE